MKEQIQTGKRVLGHGVVYLIGWLVAAAAIGGPWWLRLPMVAAAGTALGYGALWLISRRRKARKALEWLLWERGRAVKVAAVGVIAVMALGVAYGARTLYSFQMKKYDVEVAAARAEATSREQGQTAAPAPRALTDQNRSSGAATDPGSVPAAPSSPTAVGSPTAPVTSTPDVPNPGDETDVPTPKKPPASVVDATKTAEAFMKAYVQRNAPKDKWLKAVAPHASKTFAPMVATIDPSRVVASKITGRVVATQVSPDWSKPTSITVTVPTDGGVIEVKTVPEGGKWKVSDLAVADTDQGDEA